MCGNVGALRVSLGAALHWYDGQALSARAAPPTAREWLFENGSLTRRLMHLCGDQFCVKLLDERRIRPYHDESRMMAIRGGEQARVRRVLLCAGERPLVYARTVIPLSTLHGGEARRLAYLGERPLGALLFTRKGVRRSAMQLSQVSARALYPSLPESAVWGRRSVFYLADKPLLVSEFFLPALFELIARADEGEL